VFYFGENKFVVFPQGRQSIMIVHIYAEFVYLTVKENVFALSSFAFVLPTFKCHTPSNILFTKHVAHNAIKQKEKRKLSNSHKLHST
jgi:hypothetical protein